MPPSRAEGRSILVVVAHPDDEALGFAGVIARARAAGEPVRVAVVTNGDSPALGWAPPARGAKAGPAARCVRYGLERGREAIAAMALLGLRWSCDPRRSDVWLLGYRNGALPAIARSDAPWEGDPTGLRATYAAAGGALGRLLPGDLRYLHDRRHSLLRAPDLAGDLDLVLELAEPTDVFTHVETDGHPDHAELALQVTAALRRRGAPVTLHATLIHPEGTAETMYESALEWPNPAVPATTPEARFTPHLGFEPPPGPDGPSWGALGPPDELIETPPEMRDPDPRRNLKWRVISRYRSQLHCVRRPDGTYHPACGYLRAFVKRYEFFWTRRLD